MTVFSGQPEVTADAGRDTIVNDPNDAPVTQQIQHYYGTRLASLVHQKRDNHKQDRYDRDPCPHVQGDKHLPWTKMFCGALVLCIFMMVLAYFMYSFYPYLQYSLFTINIPFIGDFFLYFPSIKNFFLFVIRGGPTDFYLRIGILMYFWSGAFIFVNCICNNWPNRFMQVLTGVFLFLPLGLVWFLWPFSFLFKVSWTACYLWLFFLFGRSF